MRSRGCQRRAGVVVHVPFGLRVDAQNHDSWRMRDGPAIPTLGGQSYLDSDRSVNRPVSPIWPVGLVSLSRQVRDPGQQLDLSDP